MTPTKYPIDIVDFKSLPQYYSKEQDGRKPNTVRVINSEDERFKMLESGQAKRIRITNIETGEHFIRYITDYTIWSGCGVISWRHEV
jgi:hypothetical protein